MKRVFCVFFVFLLLILTACDTAYVDAGKALLGALSDGNSDSDAPDDNSSDSLAENVELLIDEQTGESYYTFKIEPDVMDCAVDGDLIHVVTFDFVYDTNLDEDKTETRYILFDSNTGKVLRDVILESTAGEIAVIDGELWISFPYRKCIKIYDKETFSEKRTLQLNHAVDTFCVYQDYLFYSEGEQWCYIYRYNMATGEEITTENGGYPEYFYTPGILVNPQEGLVYVAEYGSAGQLHSLDMETLQHVETFEHEDYAGWSDTKGVFLVDNSVYWCAFRLDADITRIEHQYSTGGGLLFVNQDYVVSRDDIYDPATGECLYTLPYEAGVAVITASGNLVYEAWGTFTVYPEKFD